MQRSMVLFNQSHWELKGMMYAKSMVGICCAAMAMVLAADAPSADAWGRRCCRVSCCAPRTCCRTVSCCYNSCCRRANCRCNNCCASSCHSCCNSCNTCGGCGSCGSSCGNGCSGEPTLAAGCGDAMGGTVVPGEIIVSPSDGGAVMEAPADAPAKAPAVDAVPEPPGDSET